MLNVEIVITTLIFMTRLSPHVKQGGIVNPLLFCVYFDGLLELLK